MLCCNTLFLPSLGRENFAFHLILSLVMFLRSLLPHEQWLMGNTQNISLSDSRENRGLKNPPAHDIAFEAKFTTNRGDVAPLQHISKKCWDALFTEGLGFGHKKEQKKSKFCLTSSEVNIVVEHAGFRTSWKCSSSSCILKTCTWGQLCKINEDWGTGRPSKPEIPKLGITGGKEQCFLRKSEHF